MHTARDRRTEPPPPFGQAGTARDDGLTLSICLRCRDGREDRDSDLERRGGRRPANAVAGALCRQPGREPRYPPARGGLHEQLQTTMHHRAPGPRRFIRLFGDLDPTLHVGDVLSVAATHAEAEGGFLPRPARPEILRAGILGRIPPFGLGGDLVEPLSPTPRHPTHESDYP